MKVIKLTASQQSGFKAHALMLRYQQMEINGFIQTCLEEGGGDIAEGWRWNEPKLQWELSDKNVDSPNAE